MENEQAFTNLVRRQRSTIYTVCYMFSNDQDEVNDLFQEVLIRLWQGWEKFRGDSDERTWVYRVALNSCISIDRKKKSRKSQQILDGVNLFDETDTKNLQTELLHNRIMKLQPFDRAIVLLWLEDLSYDEIGAIVGISAKNVSVRLVRIREQLKKCNSTTRPHGGGGEENSITKSLNTEQLWTIQMNLKKFASRYMN